MVGPLKPTSLLAQLPEPKASKPPSSHETVERNYRRATVCLEYTRPRTSPTGDRAGCKHNIGLSCGEEGGVFFLTSPLIGLIDRIMAGLSAIRMFQCGQPAVVRTRNSLEARIKTYRHPHFLQRLGHLLLQLGLPFRNPGRIVFFRHSHRLVAEHLGQVLHGGSSK